tara:strand:- start:326 stop:622 length:297 start_codon:yes stop_codon:yes gene_type:complete
MICAQCGLNMNRVKTDGWLFQMNATGVCAVWFATTYQCPLCGVRVFHESVPYQAAGKGIHLEETVEQIRNQGNDTPCFWSNEAERQEYEAAQEAANAD